MSTGPRKNRYLNRTAFYSRLLPLLLLLLSASKLSAQDAGNWSRLPDKVSVKTDEATLVHVLGQLQHQTTYTFTYDNSSVRNRMVRQLDFRSAALGTVLHELGQQAHLDFSLSGKNISVRVLPSAAANQVWQLSGRVTDNESGDPIAGATVQVGNKSLLTKEDGVYIITVSGPQSLTVSHVGYVTRAHQLIDPGTRADVHQDIVLRRQNADLHEVVVTALGIKRAERTLGYSVTKLDNQQMTDALSNNWTNAMQGKVAGLNLIKSGAGPAGSNKIILRGENSLTGSSEALIVVDGVVISGGSGQLTGAVGAGAYLDAESPSDFGSSINDINPEDIESVTVLKGPGASALYGSRGANGAIIVTTRNGRANKKGMGVTFNSNATMESVSRWPDYQYEYGQGLGGANYYSYGTTFDGSSTKSTSAAWGPKFDGQQFFQYDPNTGVAGAKRTPWVPYKDNRKDFFRTGKTFTNTLTMEGGNNVTSARLSVTNLHNDWIIPNSGYNRNTVALSVNHKLSDKLQLSSKINYTNRGSGNLPSSGYNDQAIMYFIRGMVPNSNLEWFKQYWRPGYENITQTKPFSSLLDNPYVIANEMLNKSSRNGVIGVITANYQVLKDLNLMVRTSLDFSSENRSQQRPKNTYKFPDGMYRTQNISAQEINYDFLLKYSHKFEPKIGTSASFGGSRMHNKYIRDELRADKLLYPGIYTFANSKNPPVALPYRTEYAVNSLYGMVQVSYDKYLFLDLTARNDWSSTLATPTSADRVSFFYPSANLSFIPSDLFRLPSFISYWKLRGSWARVGSGGTTPYLTAYAYNPTTFTSGLTNPGTIANPSLKYLLTTSVEVGTDIHFFQDRLNLDVALYENNTRDQIINAPVDPASGYYYTILNAGNVRNRGIEIQLNGTPLKTRQGLTWNVYGTFASNANTVTSLPAYINTYVMSKGPGSRGSIEARQGGRMGAFYGLGYLRAPDGQIVYDTMGLPKLADTAKYLGNTTPKWKASLGTTITYKQFRLNLLFDCQFGGVAYSLTTAVLSEEGKLKKTLPGRYNGIIGLGVIKNPDGTYRPNDKIANAMDYYNAHFTRDNVEANTFKTDFIKFREARLDYMLPAKMVKKWGLQRAAIGVYGRDLLMITKWPAFDPEFGTLTSDPSTGAGIISAGFEIAQFPATRSFGASLVIGL